MQQVNSINDLVPAIFEYFCYIWSFVPPVVYWLLLIIFTIYSTFCFFITNKHWSYTSKKVKIRSYLLFVVMIACWGTYFNFVVFNNGVTATAFLDWFVSLPKRIIFYCMMENWLRVLVFSIILLFVLPLIYKRMAEKDTLLDDLGVGLDPTKGYFNPNDLISFEKRPGRISMMKQGKKRLGEWEERVTKSKLINQS